MSATLPLDVAPEQAPAPEPSPEAQRSPRKRKGLERSGVEWVKLELMRVAYATRGGFLAARDPRGVVAWYALAALAPWFTYDLRLLGVFFAAALACALAARIGPLLLGLFVLSTVGQVAYLLVLVLVMGGEVGSVVGLTQAYLKLSTVSLVSMAAFVSMDPEKICDALIALRAPAILGFAVSYGYRMVPVLVDEFQTVVDGHRMRGAPSRGPGLLGWRALARGGRIAVQAFYPLILNTAKRTRTTVEALETRGFTAAMASGAGREQRLAHLRWRTGDTVLLGATLAVVVAAYALLA